MLRILTRFDDLFLFLLSGRGHVDGACMLMWTNHCSVGVVTWLLSSLDQSGRLSLNSHFWLLTMTTYAALA